MDASLTLEEQIIAELHETGFPTEMVAGSILEKRTWTVIHSPSYLDDVEHRSREFDIRADRYVTARINAPGAEGEYEIPLAVTLTIACKKSEKPWVFFTNAETVYDDQSSSIYSSSLFGDMFRATNQRPYLLNAENHRYWKAKRRARTFYQPLSKQEQPVYMPLIFHAVSSATKATLFLSSHELPKKDRIQLYYPVVVFSGDLFEADVFSEDNVTLNRSSYLQLAFHYIEYREATADESSSGPSGPQVISHQFIVDIVHISYLAKFLEIVEAEQETFMRNLVAAGKRGLL
jgi:hypothetical protein